MMSPCLAALSRSTLANVRDEGVTVMQIMMESNQGEESAASGTPGPSTLAPEAQAQMRAAQQEDAARRSAQSAPAPR